MTRKAIERVTIQRKAYGMLGRSEYPIKAGTTGRLVARQDFGDGAGYVAFIADKPNMVPTEVQRYNIENELDRLYLEATYSSKGARDAIAVGSVRKLAAKTKKQAVGDAEKELKKILSAADVADQDYMGGQDPVLVAARLAKASGWAPVRRGGYATSGRGGVAVNAFFEYLGIKRPPNV